MATTTTTAANLAPPRPAPRAMETNAGAKRRKAQPAQRILQLMESLQRGNGDPQQQQPPPPPAYTDPKSSTVGGNNVSPAVAERSVAVVKSAALVPAAGSPA
ncbi:unnamed protein product, partial [Ectocarpus sp. 12 AP-2014]